MTTSFRGWGGAWGDSWGTVTTDPNAMRGSTGFTINANGTLSSVSTGSTLKYWNGTAWVGKTLKVWDGNTWQTKTIKQWNGSTWT